MSPSEEFTLPERAARKLSEHRNGNLLEALSHPLLRIIIREIQFADQPRCVTDLENGSTPALRVVSRRDLEHHVRVLADLGVLSPVGPAILSGDHGTERLYLSNVAGDRVVKEVLVETADLDRRLSERAA